MTPTWRAHLYDVLEAGRTHPRIHAAVRAFLILVVTTTVVAVILETVPSCADQTRVLLTLIERVAVTIMTLDYALRLWVAPQGNPAAKNGSREARINYAVSSWGILDLAAILPFFVNLLCPIAPDWLRVLRLLRLLKLARYTPALSLFAAVMRNERRLLLATLWVVVVLLVLESGIMYALEREAQPAVFSSILHSMWWAIVTIATVGYGDMVPVTALGRFFGGIAIILGIAVFAVPVGILASGFASELRKRDFVVTWQMVAKVPLFAGLDAISIADIARLLKHRMVPARFTVVRRDEPADAMFFIMAGQVEVDVQPHPIRLSAGDYFGEVGLLRDTVRMATVTALDECHLLSLEVTDFHRLLKAHPNLRHSIMKIAEQRLTGVHATPAPKNDPPQSVS